jgi:hypothetical protein
MFNSAKITNQSNVVAILGTLGASSLYENGKMIGAMTDSKGFGKHKKKAKGISATDRNSSNNT